ncbi:pyridoxal-dependent decarboxylase, exosortase A system-associated [Pseudoalteromonas luteoviolacea]|uniref:pyridoxal-dependent decarboxylase, exosortase A system-associated n=1 Tax=Pseudoalteromonas luteoviolacea TaxID=43657 RepID=UPI0011547E03|nr:pyridoxal-dependent decarboxylase, exosortase A system-associated [Pseudoalteromonas luteoviolacea]TQF72947.1 pyridoxal-dependent decarboxylase, exosortase A system-associated [Pseudoalteromonas luteoviolacea]
MNHVVTPANMFPQGSLFDTVMSKTFKVGRYTLTDLIELAGQTPFYVYDKEKLGEKIAYLRSVMPDSLKIHYAMKANPMPAVVDFVAPRVDGLDIASHKELRVALASGISPEHISMAGPGKTDAELKAAICAGIVLHVESENELSRIYTLNESLNKPLKLALRVNPDFKVSGAGMQMGGGSQQFGIDAEIVSDVIKRHKCQSDIIGFHIFSGSQNLNITALEGIITQTFELANRLTQESGINISHLNIGGGLGIPYFPGDEELDIGHIAEVIRIELEKWHATYPQCKVISELGRFIVGESGYYISKIIDKKVSREKTFLVVDGGMHHHLAVSGNFGQVIRKNYPVKVVSNSYSAEVEKVSIVGPLCTPLDLMASNMELQKADVGDYVIIYQSGAYGYTASPHHFLSHPMPIEFLI